MFAQAILTISVENTPKSRELRAMQLRLAKDVRSDCWLTIIMARPRASALFAYGILGRCANLAVSKL